MTNDEAKELYINAVQAFDAKDFDRALSMFEALDAERPNSRHVTYHRCICLGHLGRTVEAREHLAKIEGKLEREKLSEIRALLGAPSASASRAPEIPVAAPLAEAPEMLGDNVLVIESAFPKSTTETTITGHIRFGTFRTGDSLTIITESGMPLVAPIVRIGTAETPLKMARAGQKAIMLLQVEPHHVVPGSSATCVSQEESYAETMVVGIHDDASAASTASQMGGALLELDRKIRSGDFGGALEKLSAYIEADPKSCAGHRLLARIYLEGGDGFRDPKKALEHIRRSYELGGAEDPIVVDTLAQAMAANGEAEHGLRFLERLFTTTREFEAKGALGQRIVEFRSRHHLGHVWEFADNFGDVIFESGDIIEIIKAFKSNTVPRSSLCKKDRVGEWRKVEETIAIEHPEIGSLFKTATPKRSPVMLYVIISLLVALIVAAIIIF
jgi:tetratricopeptide (TPR) repeat protein